MDKKKGKSELRNKYHLKDGESLNYFYNMNEGKVSHVLENVLSSDDHGANNYVLINKTKKKSKDILLIMPQSLMVLLFVKWYLMLVLLLVAR